MKSQLYPVSADQGRRWLRPLAALGIPVLVAISVAGAGPVARLTAPAPQSATSGLPTALVTPAPALTQIATAPVAGPAGMPDHGDMSGPATSAANTPAAILPAKPDVPAGVEQAVRIENFAFAPAVLTVYAGDTVRWTNADKAPHTATGDNFNSDILEQNGSFAFRFPQPGTYGYVCILHEGMTGQVIVLPADQRPASGATGGAAPTPRPTAPLVVPPPTKPPAAPANPAGTGTNAPATVEVSIQGFAFSPAQITVRAGDTVRWTNRDSAAHTATARGGLFDSGTLARGASFEFTFTQPGTYAYFCARHPEMTGQIVVTAGGVAPGGAAAPPAPAPTTATAPAPADDHGGHGGDDPPGDDRGGNRGPGGGGDDRGSGDDNRGHGGGSNSGPGGDDNSGSGSR